MEIKGTTIYINRGNKLLFNYQIMNGEEPYEFVSGDKIRFSIYNKSGLNQDALIQKEFEPEVGTDNIDIEINSEEMKIGEMLNKEKEYWYEITLNEETTLGYDDDGAKKLILYPEGKDNDSNTEDNEQSNA